MAHFYKDKRPWPLT